ncbi:hypothetical protein M1D49_07940 [Bacillus sp. PK3-056]|uniref:hypothetical protein n=1 Tax=Niallia circulans TaxID=1397 RepID=UPI000F44B11A|nr:hypothetical protein [Niallia circulans]AYV74290.1 hypothetical protein C2H98_23525 [Niallia circulans]
MAKLTGVKTIDMVGGEITKVEYNGELYAKVDGDAKEGDLLLATSYEVWDVNPGDFFAVKSEGEYFDNNDDERDANHAGLREYYRYFRKESTQATTLESRVETLETKVAALEGNEVGNGEYRKVTDRKPRVGDFVKYNSDNDDDDITVGKFYEVVSVDCDGDPRFIDNEGDETYAADYENWELYEKVGAADESTALRVGDYAKITEDSYEYKVGDIVKIISEESSIFDFRVEYVHVQKVRGSGQTNGFIDRSFATIATDEEVAEAQAKAKEAERWAAIGRKPNEYKKGDIVNNTGLAKCGFGEVLSISTDRIRVRYSRPDFGTCSETVNIIELITPVEQRFDLADGDSE